MQVWSRIQDVVNDLIAKIKKGTANLALASVVRLCAVMGQEQRLVCKKSVKSRKKIKGLKELESIWVAARGFTCALQGKNSFPNRFSSAFAVI